MRLLPGPAHFEVTELPAYAPDGAGEHLYVYVEKEGLNSDDVVEALVRATGCPKRDVGLAGRKDRVAIARQWFSVRLAREESLAKLEAPGGGRLRVLEVARHRNKLRLGHLRGNRFRLGLGEVTEPETLRESLARLARDGIDNRFGPQRFGHGRKNLAVARAWGSGDFLEAAALCAGSEGEWRPGLFRRVAVALHRHPSDPAGALRAGGRPLVQLIASAAQSAVFNAVLEARRAAGLTHVLRAGDVVRRKGGGLFRCLAEDVADVNRRAAAGTLEVFATGPLPGPDVYAPSAEVTREEQAWSAATGVDWAWFGDDSPLASPGDRRTLVVPFLEPPVLEAGAEVSWLAFALPPGSFATEVLTQCGVEGRV
jgi:tRNA pseudouridine13 synthase